MSGQQIAMMVWRIRSCGGAIWAHYRLSRNRLAGCAALAATIVSDVFANYAHMFPSDFVARKSCAALKSLHYNAGLFLCLTLQDIRELKSLVP